MSNKPGYKTTEIGEIPEEWEIVTLKDKRVSKKLQAGGTPLRSIKEYYENGKIPFVRIEDMTKNEHYLDDTEIKITEKGLETSSAWLVPPNTILFSMYASYGEVVINKIHVATNQAIIAIMPQENVHIEYLYYSLKQLKAKLYRHLRETTQKNLNAKIVRNLKIPLPPFTEQQKVASILCTVDEDIQKTNEIIQKTEELKKGLMQRLLTKGIGHTKFKQTEIGEIPEEWEVVRLGDCMKYGPQNGLYKHESFYRRGTQIVRIDDFYDGIFRRTSGFERVELSDDEVSTYQLKPDDILVNRVNSLPYLGKAAIVPLLAEPTVFESNMMRFATNPEILLPEYTIRWLCTSHAKRHFQRRAKRAVAQASINQKDVCSLRIAKPPISEQKKIVTILSSVDEKIAEEQSHKTQLERLKKGLMQDLLTGRVRAKVN